MSACCLRNSAAAQCIMPPHGTLRILSLPPPGHTRFATSSIPLATESHPHRWTPEVPASVWRSDAAAPAGLSAGTEDFAVYITHNGQ